MDYKLPELPLCPYHGDKPPAEGIAKCHICWRRFYIPMDWAPKLSRLNHEIKNYHDQVERANQYIALRGEGFETNVVAPKDVLVEFALPDNTRVVGREIDDLMGKTFPVKADANETEIKSYLGWRIVRNPNCPCLVCQGSIPTAFTAAGYSPEHIPPPITVKVL